MAIRFRAGGALLCVVLGLAGASASAADDVDSLARDVDRLLSLRQVKDLQRSYAHYAQYGQWSEMAALFTKDATFIRGTETVNGRTAIEGWLTRRGGGKHGLPAGALHTEFIDEPLANLSVDGRSAKVRWMSLSFLGDGQGKARIEGGIYENEYVREARGDWKISVSHYYAQYSGSYEDGWINETGGDLPIIPYHFTVDQSGVPIPPAVGSAPPSKESFASLTQTIDRLNDEDSVRNLQHAYGYYVDRKMWDDVIDLFTSDGLLEIRGVGVYNGPANIRRALERDGPPGLTSGQLNDHPLFDTMIDIAPNGEEALVRGLDFGMLGDFSSGKAQWSVSVFTNRFVKQDGVWKIREMRVFPLLKTDYSEGWGKSGIISEGTVPAFLPHPVTGQKAARGTSTKTPSGNLEARIVEAERRLAVSKAYDGAENITSAYTHYIDDGQWTSVGAIFAEHGGKEVPFNGYYFGPERIAHRPGAKPAPNSTSPGRGGWHWLFQPVIHVASDGRSAKMRARLFHPGTGFNPGGGLEGGMYPNNQAVLENGVWKLWSLTIDEPYFSSQFPYGWSRSAPPRPGPAAAARPAGTPPPPSGAELYPPDIPLARLGKRMEKFAGGTGETVRWPGILNMWFHYKNPVSGRVPEHYWPNCGTCEYAPETSMEKYGYLLPPS